MRNRSVPAASLLAHITYQNIPEAVAWLTKTFGFVENFRYGSPDGVIQGVQMHLGDAWIMLNSPRTDRGSPEQLGGWSQSLTVFVDDVDAHFARAKAAGARIVEDMNETMYGERQFGVIDLEGHHWLIAKHVRDVHPSEWGATAAGS